MNTKEAINLSAGAKFGLGSLLCFIIAGAIYYFASISNVKSDDSLLAVLSIIGLVGAGIFFLFFAAHAENIERREAEYIERIENERRK